MKVLILGAGGMLGHQLWKEWRGEFDLYGTVRQPVHAYARWNLFHPGDRVCELDVTDDGSLYSLLNEIRPSAVVNCVGIIKQVAAARDPVTSIVVNALLPHRLARACTAIGARLYHISTDCVFSGEKGSYTEADNPDPIDFYGKSKMLGEVLGDNCTTLRTSIIGYELGTSSGLIEWFLASRGTRIKGFTKALYSGLTTKELSRVLKMMLGSSQHPSGLWHVSSSTISKYELLMKARDVFDWEGEIEPDAQVVCDRSLNSNRFRAQWGYCPPSWSAMLAELAGERSER